jgi:hypothetical protein
MALVAKTNARPAPNIGCYFTGLIKPSIFYSILVSARDIYYIFYNHIYTHLNFLKIITVLQ